LKEFKTSFAPISNEETLVLILGSLPGEKSLAMNEYYGHPRNRFWKIIAKFTNNNFPTTYSEKKELLLKNKIAVWDIVKQGDRKGSLDTAILNEMPNDIDVFIATHKKLKAIFFNGKKTELLYDKYLQRKEKLHYYSLPSTSPANAAFSDEKLYEHWKQIQLFL
jgi:hypoxanthine-DNA glycosylase